MSEPSGRRHLAVLLVEIASQAIRRARVHDARLVLGGLRALRPGLEELDSFEAWIAMADGRWDEAIGILRDLEARRPDWPLGSALMVYCQYVNGDPEWSERAQRLIRDGAHSPGVGLVRLLVEPGAWRADA